MKRIILAGFLIVAAGVPSLMAEQKLPAPKSKGELAAIQAMLGATTPDAQIQAAEALVTKYADTQFKDIALYIEAAAYRQKGDTDKAEFYADLALQANPQNYQASLLLSGSIAAHAGEHDLDLNDKAAKVDKYVSQTLASIAVAPKPNPSLPDQQWENLKKDFIAEAHNNLGLMALTLKKGDVALKEFKAAIDLGSNVEPAYQVRLASAYQLNGQNDEAIALCDKLMADPGMDSRIKQAAQSVRVTAVRAKAVPKKAAPAGPAEVEIKRQ